MIVINLIHQLKECLSESPASLGCVGNTVSLRYVDLLCCFQGPVFFLEDGKSAISLNDALMWAKVNPFSPLGTGVRMNPF